MSHNPEDILKEVIVEGAKVILPEAYGDLAKPAAKSTGKVIAIIPQVIEAALVDVQIWAVERQYKLAETKKLLAIKLENVDPEKIVSPEPYIAVPALQAISYSMDSDELRDMYANLLASAMNEDTKDSVHPSFVEIIKQLSPFDSMLFQAISNKALNPLINLWMRRKNGQGKPIHENIYIYESAEPLDFDLISTSICNLDRLKLIDVYMMDHYANEDVYEQILSHRDYKKIVQKLDTDLKEAGLQDVETESYSSVPQLGSLNKTPLGKLFASICFD